MRFLPGLICLLPLLSPLAHAELIDDVNDRGELRIAVEANTPPFNFKDDDKLTGFEVELGQLLASELDVRADFVVTDGSDLLTGVESGKYDIASTTAMTPELRIVSTSANLHSHWMRIDRTERRTTANAAGAVAD